MAENKKELTPEERKVISHRRIFWLAVFINFALLAYLIYQIIAISLG